METKKTYTIEVDAEIWDFLQANAEPLIDTVSDVLKRHLFKKNISPSTDRWTIKTNNKSSTHLRANRALKQIFRVIELVIKNGYYRIDATHKVAAEYNVLYPTVLDKYCRGLGVLRDQFDLLLMDQSLEELEKLLNEKHPRSSNEIISFFNYLRE